MVFEAYSSTVKNDMVPQTRKSSFKAMQNYAIGDTHSSHTGAVVESIKVKNNNGVSNQQDVWGPVFKNKEHFVDMHFC